MPKHYPTTLQAFTLLFRLVLFIFLIILPFTVASTISELELINVITKPVFSATLLSIVNLLIIYYGLYRIKKNRKYSLLNELKILPSNTYILLSVFCTLSIIILSDPIVELIPPSQQVIGMFKEIIDNSVIAISFAVIILPITEEIIFRGIILNGFLKNYSPIKAILISSVLFGLIHMNIHQSVFAFIFSCFLGFVYWQSKSLLLCILIHAINNFISFLFSIKWGIESSLFSVINSSFLYLSIYLVAAIIATYCILRMYKKYLI